jgi:drug/metabolite transporter (DMT)-like permease
MQKSSINKHLQLHFIVFIWGFTAVLGKLIPISAIPLVWHRLLIAVVSLSIILYFSRLKHKPTSKYYLRFAFGGIIIGLHWLTFFYAIKISNVSITLATLSTGAFFASILEPLFFNKKIKLYEIILAGLTVIGIIYIFNVQIENSKGIIIALISAFLSALFSIVNAQYIKNYNSIILTFYELIFAFLLITIFMIINGEFNQSLFNLSITDIAYLIILGTICTAFALTYSNKLLSKVSPFTMMLTVNLEPVYGIILAILIFKESEYMNVHFYYGAILILITVFINGIIKTLKKER